MAAFSRSARMRNSCVHLLQCCNPEPVRCINRNSTAMPSATIPASTSAPCCVRAPRSTMSEVARQWTTARLIERPACAFRKPSCRRACTRRALLQSTAGPRQDRVDDGRRIALRIHMVQSIVMRLAALALLLTLVAPSVARIACEWDCIEQRAAAHAASCHEEESGDGDSLTAASMTTCHDDRAFVVARGASLAANSAALVDGSTPLSSPMALLPRRPQ